jgi:hypothetical protein
MTVEKENNEEEKELYGVAAVVQVYRPGSYFIIELFPCNTLQVNRFVSCSSP